MSWLVWFIAGFAAAVLCLIALLLIAGAVAAHKAP